MEKLTLRITSVGPFTGSVDLTFPGPGLYALRGRNGSGKSCLLAAIAGIGKGTPLNAHTHNLPDGTPVKATATVEEIRPDGQVALIATTSRKRNVTTDAPTVEPAEAGTLWTLNTGDDLVDPIKADAARIKALSSLFPDAFRATAEDLALLSSGIDLGDLASLVGKDLTDARAAIHARLSEMARKAEDAATAAKGSTATHRTNLANRPVLPDVSPEVVPLLSLDLAALESEGHRLNTEHARIQERHNRRVSLERAKANQAPRPEVKPYQDKVDTAKSDMDAKEKAHKEAVAKADATRKEIRELQARLALEVQSETQAQQAYHAAEYTWKDRQKDVEETEKAILRWDEAQKSYADIETLPTTADVEKAAKALEEARTRYANANYAQQTHKLHEDRKKERADLEIAIKDTEKTATEEEAKGKRLRIAAQATPQRLGECLARHGLPCGLTIQDGRLYANVDGKTALFADPSGRCLSDGQRIGALLDVGIAAFPGRIVPIPGSAFAELDPGRVEHLKSGAIARGAIILTARATDGDTVTVESL